MAKNNKAYLLLIYFYGIIYLRLVRTLFHRVKKWKKLFKIKSKEAQYMKNIKLKFLRALSLLLASLFIINPFGTSPQMLEDKAQIDNSGASSKIIDENNKLISSEGISGHDDRFTFQKVVENYTNMLITSGVVVISGLGLLINYAVTNAQHTINPKELIDQYINDSLPSPISADMWFTRLGGTQEKLAAYNNAKERTISQDAATYNEFLNKCNDLKYETACKFHDMFEQIAKDVPRTSFGGKNFQLNTSTSHSDGACIVQFRRILFIYYMYWAPENKKHDFVQGETDILAMIYSKFLGHNKILTDDDEAKVCYVFSQLMLVKGKFDMAMKKGVSDEVSLQLFLKPHINTFSNNLSPKKDSMQWSSLISAAKECDLDLANMALVTHVQTLGLRLFKDAEAIIMWDHIIMDNSMFSEDHLNYDKVFSTIVNLTLSLLLERSKNINLNNSVALASLLTLSS